ncbi:hypothetical protein ACX9R5_13275 [Rathayibacter sp. CAU 1779]
MTPAEDAQLERVLDGIDPALFDHPRGRQLRTAIYASYPGRIPCSRRELERLCVSRTGNRSGKERPRPPEATGAQEAVRQTSHDRNADR